MAPEPERVRHSRMLSFTSNKSEKSSKKKLQLFETHKEKEANRVHSHADPSRAIHEAEPSAIALEESNMTNLRAMEHKDRFGNPITDPDAANPTRYRLERPLETIRAFEAAIDGTYSNRRMSYVRDDSVNGQSRPNSYFGGDPRGNLTYQGNDFNTNSNNYRGGPSRRDSYADAYGNNGYNQYNGYHEPRASRPPRRGGRPQGHSPTGYAPNHNGQHQNYESGSASGSGNHSMDQLAQSTDPSSLNSSRDGLQQQHQQSQQPQFQQQKVEHQQIGESYGFTGFGTDPQLENTQQPFPLSNNSHASNVNGAGVQGGNTYSSQAFAPPAPPAKDSSSKPPMLETIRKNSFLRKNSTKDKDTGEKRKSWFKRLGKT